MKNKLVFCTLFDHNYMARGISLYHSLERNCKNFELWVIAMSDICEQALKKMNLENIKIVSLADFEDDELLKAKKTRSQVEYFWTLTPSIPLYVLKKNPGLKMVTYVDADLYFFSDPKPIFEEMGDDSVLIIEHRYSKERQEWEKTSGKYNVEMLIFKNNEIGLRVLKRWREQCNEWCYYREEEGKFGDQMYLNTWPKDYKKIHVLKHLGGGLAPWNIKNYSLTKKGGDVYVNDDKLIFYHFHAFKYWKNQEIEHSSGYNFSSKEINLIYDQYIKEIYSNQKEIETFNDDFKYGYMSERSLFEKIKSVISKAIYVKW